MHTPPRLNAPFFSGNFRIGHAPVMLMFRKLS